MTVPADGGPGGQRPDPEVAAEPVYPPLVPLSTGPLPTEPAADPQERERAATAQRNKDAFARLGRKVAGATRSAADATGAAARDAAARTSETAGALRDQVAERVSDATEKAGTQPTGTQPAGNRVVIAGPGQPTGTGGVTLRPAEPGEGGAGPQASSVVVQPLAGSSLRTDVQDTGVQDLAQAAGDRADAAGRHAAEAGRSALDTGQHAAATAGAQVSTRAEQAGAAAQRAGAAAQQAGAAALEQTRTALGDAVVGGKATVRARTAPPVDLEALAAQVVALPGVARLAPDAAGRGRGLLPGQVAGAQVTDDALTVRVVARYGARLPDLADRIHELAAGYAEGRQTVVEIPDLDVDDSDSASGFDSDLDATAGSTARRPDPSTSPEGNS